MRTSLFIFYLLFISFGQAQNGELVLTNSETQKVIIIKEKKRIKVKLKNGKMLAGRFKTLDEETIRLGRIPISISDIQKIKKHPFLASLGNSIAFVSLGAGVGLVGPIVLNQSKNKYSPALFFVSGIVIVATGFLPINYWNKRYMRDKGWQLAIKKSPLGLSHRSNGYYVAITFTEL